MDKFMVYIKKYMVDTLLITMLTTILLRNCGARDILTERVIPEIESTNLKLSQIDKKLEIISNETAKTSEILKAVSIDLGAIKNKYVHPEKEGVNCEVRQSKYINDNEIGIISDNEYKLVSGKRILVMNMNTASKPSMTLTVTTDIKKEDDDFKNQFFLNSQMLSQLGINTHKNKRGVYNLRFFIIE